MLMRFAVVLMAGIVLNWGVSSAVASQKAEVIQDQTPVFESPQYASSVISILPKGTVLFSSSKMIRDHEGTYWYKIQLPSKMFGYIHANALLTSELKQDLHEVGVSRSIEVPEGGDHPWTFLIRGMVLAGSSSAKGFELGGEGEFTVCVPFSSNGYLHRLLSLGMAYIPLPMDPVIAGAAVIRVYEESRFEPELRLRVGQGLRSGSLEGGVNLGIDYPLSFDYRNHLSAYFEAGSLFAFSGATSHIWGSMGLGLHF